MSTDPATAGKATQAPTEPRPFSEVIKEVSKGSAHLNASEQLREVVQAVKATGKAGSVTVTVNVTHSKKGDHLSVTATARAKVPAFEPKESIYFVDGAGNLTRHDPDQLALLGDR